MTNKILSSPQSMIWQHVKSNRRILNRLENSDLSKDEFNQDVVLGIINSILIVETFYNIYFRYLIEFGGYIKNKGQICTKKPVSLDFKLKNWTKFLFNNSLNLKSGVGKSFMDLKRFRNSFIHHKYEPTSYKFDNFQFEGLDDVTYYETLGTRHAKDAFATAISLIFEIIMLNPKLSHEDHEWELQHWTGIIISVEKDAVWSGY